MTMPSKTVEEVFAQFQAGWRRSLEVRKAAGQPYERCNGPMYEIDGMMISSGIFPREAVERVSQLETRQGDVMICTYPRCGTTWLSAILNLVHNQPDCQADDRAAFKHNQDVLYLEMYGPGQPASGIERIVDIPSPRLMLTHLPMRYFQKQLESGKFKVVACTRDPRDMLVSLYHFHDEIMAKCHEGSFDDFFQLFRGGKLHFGDCFTHTKETLAAAQKFPDSVMVLKYEDIHKDHGFVVKQVAEFCGINITAETIDKIIQKTSFSSMKNNAATNPNFGVSNITKPADSQFVRKGIVGEWQEGYFTPEMLQEMREMNKDKMGEFASWFDL